LEQRQLSADITASGDGEPMADFAEGAELRGLIGEAIPKRDVLKIDPSSYTALIAPGGSLLQDATSVRSLLYYLWVIRRFLVARKPVFLMNQGIGPLNSWVADFFTPRYLRAVTMLSLRDQDSFDWAQEKRILASHPQLYLACDPMLDPPFTAKRPVFLDEEGDGGYALVIAKPTRDLPHPGDQTTEEEALASLIRQVRRTTGGHVVITGLHSDQDQAFCERTAERARDCASYIALPEEPGRFNVLLGLIAGAQLVVSYRLHGLITAAAYGVPALGVAYDPKIMSFCMEAALPYCFPATVHEDSAHQDLRRLWQDREEVVEIMCARLQAMLSRLRTAEERFDALW
jgi:polysaccharide pyruvyl transferase CsaB